jgi:hypothetical protein
MPVGPYTGQPVGSKCSPPDYGVARSSGDRPFPGPGDMRRQNKFLEIKLSENE